MNLTTLEQGFSPDGYIVDQDCFHTLRYRTMPANINSCGPIAAYNLRRYLGQDPDFSQVLRELEGMHLWNVPGPTLMNVMRPYLQEYIPGIRETVGREAALASAERSLAGIFRYRERREPHFVSYIRLDDGRFRFFNVADGLEDAAMPMFRFGAEHLLGGTVIVFTVEE